MRILIVSSNITLSPYPLYPLGASVIASALSSAGHDVVQFDYLQNNTSLDAFAGEVRRFQPELVGISVRNVDNVNFMSEQYYIDVVKDIVARVRRESEATVILGGAGFSLLPDLILQETNADYGIIGEGESLIVEFARNAARGIYPDKRLLVSNGRLTGAEICAAQYDQTLMQYYLHNGNIASVQTKRGCTYKCVYCSYPALEGATIRRRAPRAVVDDIESLRDVHHAKYVFFVDSVFNDDEGAYLDVIDEMIRRKVTIPWTCFLKPKGLNDEIIERMKMTGFAAAEIGSDAACDVTLRKMGKTFCFSDIAECNDLLAKHGIATSHFFMFGGPGETKETVAEGISNILSLKNSVSFIFMGIRIFPDTALYRLALQENILSPHEPLLKPFFYFSPSVEKKWMEDTLTKGFAQIRHCVFPPDSLDSSLTVLHKLGYSGPMWDLLVPGKKETKRVRHAAK